MLMSPFEVTTTKDRGYLGGNAQSGTRLNSDIDDIAAAVTVVTKQQLLDTAAIDINDIFQYEASTEGTRTYTANFNDGKADVDSVSLAPETANRVRGLGSANVAVGNFQATSSIPIDTYNIDAVELSRGPNSSIFGVGEVSGTVNLVPAAANTSRDFTKLSASISSFGTTRETADVNRVFWKNKFALRLNALNQNQEFRRKPSFDQTRRFQLGGTFRPFSTTTITASFERFRENYSRPNSVTPRELYSHWNAWGRPSWDPTTNTWTVTDAAGNKITGTQASASNITTFPVGVMLQGIGSSRVRPTMFIGGDGSVGWFGDTLWTNPTRRELINILYPSDYARPAQYGSTSAGTATLNYNNLPATNNHDLYDWDSINLAALNRGHKDADFARIVLEQYVLRTEMNTIAFQAGYYKENIQDYRRTYVGNGGDGVALTITPDVNTKLPDGTPNPYYGAPYIGALAPQVYANPVKTETARLNLAYQLDFRQKKSFWHWLGKYNLLGYGETYNKIYVPASLRYRDQIVAPESPWLLPNIRNNNAAVWNARYYLGDATGNNVDYASAAPALAPVTYHRANPATGTTVDPNVPINSWYTIPNVPLGTAFFSSQTPAQVKNTTWGGLIQGYLLGDRIIGTFGRRRDQLATRNNTTPEPTSAIDSATGLNKNLDYLWDFSDDPYLVTDLRNGATKNVGYTSTKGLVVKPFRWISLRYNTSNSFKPDNFAIDLQGRPQPNPHGKTKDYGVQLNLWKDKVWLRVTRFYTDSEGSRSNTASTVANRITNFDFDRDPNNDGNVKEDLEDWLTGELLKVRGYYDPVAGALLANIPDDVRLQAKNDADKLMGFTPEQIAFLQSFQNSRLVTADTSSRGYEVELNFNPNRYWTVKLTGSETVNIISAIGSSWQEYRDARMPIWTTIRSPYDNSLYWTTRFAGDRFPNQVWVAENAAPMSVQMALLGKPSPQTRKYKGALLSTYRLAGLSSNSILRALTVGGSVRWEDKGAIGFYGAAPDPDGLVRSYDANRPIYDSAHLFADAWVRYDFSLYKNRIKGNVQLNVRNVLENGRLEAFGANPDGTKYNFRIYDPREFVLGVNFEL